MTRQRRWSRLRQTTNHRAQSRNQLERSRCNLYGKIAKSTEVKQKIKFENLSACYLVRNDATSSTVVVRDDEPKTAAAAATRVRKLMCKSNDSPGKRCLRGAADFAVVEVFADSGPTACGKPVASADVTAVGVGLVDIEVFREIAVER